MKSETTSKQNKKKILDPEAKLRSIELRKKFPPTYGRKKSRSLHEGQKRAMTEYYPKLKIDISDGKEFKKFLAELKNKEVLLEIGFGGGEHLIHQAKQNENALVIGCEVYLNSFAVCVQRAQKEGLANIRLLNDDSRLLLEKMPKASVDKIYILFPDPWPKKKQFKRRIVNPQVLSLMHPLLKDNGVIRLATDIDSYFEQMLKVFAADTRFKLISKEKDFAKMPKDHIKTKYHEKADREGRVSRFLEYKLSL